MRHKESITGREMEVLLLLAINENQTAAAIRRKLEKKVDKTSIWKTLHSLEKKELIGNSPVPPSRETNPRGGRGAIKRYFILDDKYDDIYLELKKRGKKFAPVIEGKYIVSHPFPPDIAERYPEEDIMDYRMRTGFWGPWEAQVFRDCFTEVRRATEEEIALHNILRNCNDYVRDAEKAERMRDKYLDGFWLGPLYSEEE